jgi:glycosyltransferase involved in cell wall biosynthesis
LGSPGRKNGLLDRHLQKLNVVVGWNGLPVYGARLIASARKKFRNEFHVIATPPYSPVKGIDEILPTNLRWIDSDIVYSWSKLSMDIPDIFFHTGWRYKHFISLADEVRSAGGKVVGMFDNNWKGNSRQIIGGLYFRLCLRKKYSAVFVPGIEGYCLARYIGFSDENIYSGLYGASNLIFSNQIRCNDRPKTFLFVGQLVKRKGVLELVEAFKNFHQHRPDWTLRIIGQGNLESQIEQCEGLSVEPFKQVEEIAKTMQLSRVLILPSQEEHWGLVVHEATLSGCGLLLTSQVGAAADLATSKNAVIIKRTSVDLLIKGMNRFADMEDHDIDAMEETSIKNSNKFGTEYWAEKFCTILCDLKM